MESRQNHSARPFFAKFLQYIKEQFHGIKNNKCGCTVMDIYVAFCQTFDLLMSLHLLEKIGHNLLHIIFVSRSWYLIQCSRRKEKSKWNWPELHLYCGVCELKTGLYIRSVLSMLIYIVSLIINVIILCYLVRSGIKFCTMDKSDIEEYFGVYFTEVKIYRIKMIYTVLISYMMFWVLFRVVHIGGVFLTIYAVYKKKPKIVKFVLYVSSINWILCIFISIYGIMILEMFSRVLVIICILYEGYNLMALNSEYKKLSGKSKLLMNLSYTEGDAEATPNPSPSSQPEVTDQRMYDNRKHCNTCNCYAELNQNSAVPTIEENVPIETPSDPNQALDQPDLEPETKKALNIKDAETIFNQDLLVPSQSAVLEVAQSANVTLLEASGHKIARPRTLRLPPYPEKKIDIVDIPIIYDENQLHIGGSPVIEEQRSPQLSN